MSLNLDDLTLGDIKKLNGIMSSNDSKSVPVEIGKAYLFRTVTHIELGRVVCVDGQFITLDNASWVADTGRYHDCLKKGTLSEVEPYPSTTTVNASSLINFTPWNHPLPTEQK